MKKSIQDEIDALKAETAAAYAAIAAYNRKKEFYRQQADEEIGRASCRERV